MRSFYESLIEWQAADRAACEAERALAPQLDLYCQGRAPAPHAEVIAQVKRRRQETRDALHRLLECVARPRIQLPLL